MSPAGPAGQEQWRRAVPVFFIVGGIAFAYSSVRPDVDLYAQLFGVGAGLVALVYGVVRMLQDRRRERERTDGPPPPPSTG